MEIRVNDVLTMKKPHPCGSHEWLVLRTGADLRLRCQGCGREIFRPRFQLEKGVKSVRPAVESFDPAGQIAAVKGDGK